MTEENDKMETTPAPAEKTSQEPMSMIDKARAENERMEKNFERREALLVREEKMAAHNMLGGKSQAGQAPPPKEEQSASDYTKQVMAGEIPE